MLGSQDIGQNHTYAFKQNCFLKLLSLWMKTVFIFFLFELASHEKKTLLQPPSQDVLQLVKGQL